MADKAMFLGTTALSEFWDKSQEILFLGSWCLRYDRRTEWADLKYQVMPSPWNDRKRFYSACIYLDKCYERMLCSLIEYLNSTHRVSYSRRYWRILLGPWLMDYLHVVYDRYIHLAEAFGRIPDLQTIVIDKDEFAIPRDTTEFHSFVVEDQYNLQIFSQLLLGMGYEFPTRSFRRKWPDCNQGVTKKPLRRFIRNLIRLGVGSAVKGMTYVFPTTGRIALCDMYCPRSALLALIRQTGFRALPLALPTETLFKLSPPVFDERRRGLGRLRAIGEFERVFVRILPQNFPTLYLESFETFRSSNLPQCRRLPSVLVSLTGWYTNEALKFLAAEASQNGCRLVTAQHGGGYGIYRFHPYELHESKIGDSFIVWGWANECAKTVRNLPNPKLSLLLANLQNDTRCQKDSAVLFVSTANSRLLYRFHSSPVGTQWEAYFQWELRFLAALPNWVRSTMRIRPYMHEFGWAAQERLAETFPDLQWDKHRSLYRSLRHCRLVVVDHCGTTFLETVSANIPTVLFWDPNRWEVREDAKPYFQDLREVGILWDSPEAAAKKIAEVYDEPWSWWGSRAVQETRHRFVNRYALVREDWLDCWVKVLEEELALSREKED